MNILDPHFDTRPIDIATQLSQIFAQTAAERDKQGGNPKHERDLIRQSGLLSLSIPCEFGGQGASWQTIFKTIQIPDINSLARLDFS